jgi:hypothetical protein
MAHMLAAREAYMGMQSPYIARATIASSKESIDRQLTVCLVSQ